jgi:hypothetical protein
VCEILNLLSVSHNIGTGFSMLDAINQEPLARRVIKQGNANRCKVEVYLVDLKLCRYNDVEHPVVQYFSQVDTLGEY